IPIKDYLEFMGYYLSEGYLCKHIQKTKPSGSYDVNICQIKTSQYFYKIKKCLEKLPFNFKYYSNTFSVGKQQLFQYLEQFGKSGNRYIPNKIKKLSKGEFRP
ncbi:unnamed protein product, partial [marine sediment metagenome]